MTTTYYLEHSNLSDITSYHTLVTTNAANPASNIRMEYLNSIHPVIADELVTEPGVPGAITITAVYGFLASIWAQTDVLSNVYEITVDLLRYKTTGTIATRTVNLEFHAEPGTGKDARDYIKRGDLNGSWITDGFTVGCRILVAGTTWNNGSFLVQEVTATTLTLAPFNFLSRSDIGDIEIALGATVSTKEKQFATATGPKFSHIEQQETFTNSGNIPDETFAADDRLVVKVWVRRVSGNSDAQMVVETEGTHPASVVIS
jgi:hypothetical protein